MSDMTVSHRVNLPSLPDAILPHLCSLPQER